MNAINIDIYYGYNNDDSNKYVKGFSIIEHKIIDIYNKITFNNKIHCNHFLGYKTNRIYDYYISIDMTTYNYIGKTIPGIIFINLFNDQ